MAGSEIQLGDDVEEYDLDDNTQAGNLNKNLSKDLNDVDLLVFYNLLKTLKLDQYKYPPASFESGKYEFMRDMFHQKIADIQTIFLTEEDDLEAQGMNNIMLSNIIDNWTRVEV